MAKPTWDETEEIIEDAPRFEDTTEAPKFEDTQAIEDVEPEDNTMGVGEAALTGFGEGASFGLAPILGGLMSVGGELAGDIADLTGLTEEAKLEAQGFKNVDDKPGLQGLIDSYYEGREGVKDQQSKAFDDQMAASLAGNLAGGMAILPGAGLLSQGLSKGGKIAQVAAKALPAIDKTKGLSTARKMGIAAREGVKAGSLAGFGSGESKLIDEDKSLLEGAKGIAEETAMTGLGGAVLGGGLSGLATGAGKVLRAIPGSKAFGLGKTLGREGIPLEDKAIKDQVKQLSHTIREKAGDAFRKAGKSKADALQYADELGIRANAGEEINEVIDDLITRGAASIEDQAEKSKFIRSMQALTGEVTAETKALDKLATKQVKQAVRLQEKGFEKVQGDIGSAATPEGKLAVATDTYVGPKNKEIVKIADQLIKDPEIALKKFDLEKISLSDLDQVINEVNRHTGELTGPAKTETEKRARQLAGALRNLSNETAEEGLSKKVAGEVQVGEFEKLLGGGDLASENLKLSRIFSALKRGGVKGNILTKSKIAKDEQIDQFRKLIQSGGDIKEMDRERFFQYLNEAAPGEFGGMEQRADILKQGLDLTQRMETSKSFNLKGLLGSAESLLAKGAHSVGSTQRAISTAPKEAAKMLQKQLYKLDSEEISKLAQGLTSKFGDKGSQFSKSLERASQADNKTKTAIMYGLYQQPAFRKMLGGLGESLVGDESDDE